MRSSVEIEGKQRFHYRPDAVSEETGFVNRTPPGFTRNETVVINGFCLPGVSLPRMWELGHGADRMVGNRIGKGMMD